MAETAGRRVQEVMKRSFDICFTAAASLLLLPLALIAGIVVWLFTGRPILYRGERVGRQGRSFTVHKFRTMVVNADAAGASVTSAGDSRITAVGRVLRMTKFDEFPQVINVLRGDMSIVGPRPDTPKYVRAYSAEQRSVLQMRPGLTCLAQALYRDEEKLLPVDGTEAFYIREVMRRKLVLDGFYVKNWSIALDIRVFLLGILALLKIQPPAILWPTELRPVVAEHHKLWRGRRRARSQSLSNALHGRLTPFLRPKLWGSHIVLAALAYLLAFVVDNNFFLLSRLQWKLFFGTLPLLLLIRLGTFSWFELFQGLWRYVGMGDIVRILKAVTFGSLIFSFASIMVNIATSFRRILFLDWLLCLALVGGARLVVRIFWGWRSGDLSLGTNRVLIVGAGDAGEMLSREIERNPRLPYTVIGFVDDDPMKQGRDIHGSEVLGSLDRVAELCGIHSVDEILIAVPSASREQRRRILQCCRKSGRPFKTLPHLNELLQDKAKIRQLEEVRPEDLLGREPVRLDIERLRQELRRQRILVTGAAGSIGSELCRQLAIFDPETLLLFDQAESGLYFVTLELSRDFPALKVVPIVGDILDRQHVEEVIRVYSPDLVYHAAAYKHVPLMEEQPLEAIANNVFGTETVAAAVREGGVKKFVLISTDKAVNPVGIMGMTKLVAEQLLQAHSGGRTTFITVRFGNVLESDGSVLPLFRWQIARGGPVTLTDPDASRYFMLLSEAAQLVLEAGTIGKGAEVFFLDMGEPVKILSLLENLTRLSGLESGKDITVEVVGLRPGERLTETLVMDAEELGPTEHEKVFMVRMPRLDGESFRRDLEVLRRRVAARDREAAVAQLQAMVARYRAEAGTRAEGT